MPSPLNLQLAPGGTNPMLQSFTQGLQAAYIPQQQQAEIDLKRAMAQQALGRGSYYDAYGNLRDVQAGNQAQGYGGNTGQAFLMAQSILSNPNASETEKAAANALMSRVAAFGLGNVPTNTPVGQGFAAGVQQQMYDANPNGSPYKAIGLQPGQTFNDYLQQYRSKTAEQNARAGYYNKGGARGATIDYLSQNGDISPEIREQAIIDTALQGATPEVKRQFEYDASQNNPILQSSIQGANLKATSNQQLLRQQAAMEQFDSAVQPMLQDVDNAVSYYSGPGGALRLRADQIKQASGGTPSPEYQAYLVAIQTQIPLIADNARKILGAQASDAMQEQLQGIIGPGGKVDTKSLALMPPAVVGQKLQSFSEYLKREAAVGRNFVGPLSMNPNEENQLQNDLSGITSTMQNMQNQSQQTSAQPPAGMTKEQYFQWLQQNGGA